LAFSLLRLAFNGIFTERVPAENPKAIKQPPYEIHVKKIKE
jgi:hypothetical protein